MLASGCKHLKINFVTDESKRRADLYRRLVWPCSEKRAFIEGFVKAKENDKGVENIGTTPVGLFTKKAILKKEYAKSSDFQTKITEPCCRCIAHKRKFDRTLTENRAEPQKPSLVL